MAALVHTSGRKSATAVAGGTGYDRDPAVALLQFYDDYRGYLDEVDPVEWEDSPRRELEIALAFASAGPRLLAETVARVRTQRRWSWSEIARVVGTTRQAAAQRWGRPAP